MGKHRKKETRICEECKNEFTAPAYTKQKFCSTRCSHIYVGRKRRTPLVSIECKQCHMIFEVKYKQRKRQFCCKHCSDIFFSGINNPACRPEVKKRISERVSETHWDSSGDKNPRWKGGSSKSFTYYNGKFTKKLKQIIRERDGYVCQICGGKDSNQVHHIDYDKSNCDENNLITLCVKCHGKCHGRINETRKEEIIKTLKMEEKTLCHMEKFV